MPVFKLRRDWSGYSEGKDTVRVSANTLEKAIEYVNTLSVNDVDRYVVRDDTTTEDWEEY